MVHVAVAADFGRGAEADADFEPAKRIALKSAEPSSVGVRSFRNFVFPYSRTSVHVFDPRLQEMVMSRITFQKRQKEMKRLEKQRMKAERRAQKKLAKNTENAAQTETPAQTETGSVPTTPEP